MNCPPRGYTGPLIYICGHGFKPGDKVSLVLEYNGRTSPMIWGLFPVNRLGEFNGWYVFSCKNRPLGVYAKDVTLMPASVTSNTLSPIPVAGCHGTTSTPRPGEHS